MLTLALDPYDNRTAIDDTQSNSEYFCPFCGEPLVTRKGEVRRHHFAHKADHACTDSWEREYDMSDWHYSWQCLFPKENQEVCLTLGETRHRADVLVGRTVIEFQKSALKQENFNDRNSFYHDLGYKVVWLFDLREPFSGGLLRRDDSDPLSFDWDNPKKAFSAYDIEAGNIDLFFQLADDGDNCIIKVRRASPLGFESFEAASAHSVDAFLDYVGLSGDACAAPIQDPTESNTEYLAFARRYGIKLNKQQARAVQAIDGANLLIAVPGSGKTTVLVARLGYMVIERGIDPDSIMSLTYTKAATKDMASRFQSTFHDAVLAGKMHFKTINGLADKIVGWVCKTEDRPKPELLQSAPKKAILRKVYDAANDERATESDLIDLETAFSYIKNMMLTPAEIEEAESELPHLADMYAAYAEMLARQNQIDFDDQLSICLYTLQKYPHFRANIQKKYRYWCVDEAQDTSKIQHEIIRLLAGTDDNVFMVGDEDQSIYGFRAAYPKAMLNFKHDYKNPYVMTMETNYRSTTEVVRVSSAFIKRCKGRYDKKMVANRSEVGKVERVEVGSRKSQTPAIMERIKSSECELAVLFRDNDGALPLIDQLLRENVEFGILSMKKTFFSNRTVQDILSFMRLARNPADEASLRQVYCKCKCYIRKNDVKWACRKRRGNDSVFDALVKQAKGHPNKQKSKEGIERAQNFKQKIRSLKGLAPSEAIERIREFGYQNYLDEAGISIGKVEVLEFIASLTKTLGELEERLRYLEQKLTELEKDKSRKKITLSTIHSSKGLEFEDVIIMDVIDGLFPSSQKSIFNASKDSADSYQEERRLFYVAMTRAKNNLAIYAIKGTDSQFTDEVFGRQKKKEASRGNAGIVQSKARPAMTYSVASLHTGRPDPDVQRFKDWQAEQDRRVQERAKENEKQARLEQKAKEESRNRARETGYREVVGQFTQQEEQIRDSHGTRWIKCDKCNEVKPEDDFSSFGGPGRVNRGICVNCMRESNR